MIHNIPILIMVSEIAIINAKCINKALQLTKQVFKKKKNMLLLIVD